MPIVFTYFLLGSQTSVNNLVISYSVETSNIELSRLYFNHLLEIITYQFPEKSHTDISLSEINDGEKRYLWSYSYDNHLNLVNSPKSYILKYILSLKSYPLKSVLLTESNFRLFNYSTQYR